uniref:Uncharacterized protein n=1 Tax=Panagrolaimus sp. ES5 TaxID=591445 RepID=A0AC34FGI1_9BILA
MRKTIKEHEEKQQKSTVKEPEQGAVPAYLLDRQKQTTGAVLSNAIKQKRKEKAGKYNVPLPKPQNEHIELHRKRFGRRLDHEERL